MRTGRKHLILAIIGGLIYVLIELVWRGHSHWTMFLLGGACFLVLGLINEVIPWDMSLQLQAFMGACIVTALEFLTGCLVNLWLGWGVWDYSGLSGNILGQICPQYFLLWVPVSLVGIVLDDWLRHLLWGEERPRYRL